MRTEQRPYLSTGHLHIPLIQNKKLLKDNRGHCTTEDLNPYIKELIEELKTIIYKI